MDPEDIEDEQNTLETRSKCKLSLCSPSLLVFVPIYAPEKKYFLFRPNFNFVCFHVL